MPAPRISAHVSQTIRDQLDAYVRATGLTRAAVIEQALAHHLQALAELPADAIVPARVVLGKESAALVAELTRRPPRPTKAMNRLFDDRSASRAPPGR